MELPPFHLRLVEDAFRRLEQLGAPHDDEWRTEDLVQRLEDSSQAPYGQACQEHGGSHPRVRGALIRCGFRPVNRG